jgi:hypothetical protein
MAINSLRFHFLVSLFLCFSIVPVAIGSEADNVRKTYGPKQAIECVYSYSMVEALIQKLEQSNPTEKGGRALSDASAKVAKYKSMVEKYFNGAEDMSVIREAFAALKADKESAKSLAHHTKVMEKCDALEQTLATSNAAEAIVSNALGINIDGDNISIGPKATKSLGQNELRIVNLTFTSRKSPWSSFKPFFEFSKKDYGLSDRPSYYPHKMYYDSKSLIKKDSYRKILTYEEGSDLEVGPLMGEKTRYYSVVVYELNCKDETYRTFGAVNVLHPIQKEKVLNVVAEDQGWTYFVRDTEVSKLYQMFCE